MKQGSYNKGSSYSTSKPVTSKDLSDSDFFLDSSKYGWDTPNAIRVPGFKSAQNREHLVEDEQVIKKMDRDIFFLHINEHKKQLRLNDNSQGISSDHQYNDIEHISGPIKDFLSMMETSALISTIHDQFDPTSSAHSSDLTSEERQQLLYEAEQLSKYPVLRDSYLDARDKNSRRLKERLFTYTLTCQRHQEANHDLSGTSTSFKASPNSKRNAAILNNPAVKMGAEKLQEVLNDPLLGDHISIVREAPRFFKELGYIANTAARQSSLAKLLTGASAISTSASSPNSNHGDRAERLVNSSQLSVRHPIHATDWDDKVMSHYTKLAQRLEKLGQYKNEVKSRLTDAYEFESEWMNKELPGKASVTHMEGLSPTERMKALQDEERLRRTIVSAQQGATHCVKVLNSALQRAELEEARALLAEKETLCLYTARLIVSLMTCREGPEIRMTLKLLVRMGCSPQEILSKWIMLDSESKSAPWCKALSLMMCLISMEARAVFWELHLCRRRAKDSSKLNIFNFWNVRINERFSNLVACQKTAYSFALVPEDKTEKKDNDFNSPQASSTIALNNSLVNLNTMQANHLQNSRKDVLNHNSISSPTSAIKRKSSIVGPKLAEKQLSASSTHKDQFNMLPQMENNRNVAVMSQNGLFLGSSPVKFDSKHNLNSTSSTKLPNLNVSAKTIGIVKNVENTSNLDKVKQQKHEKTMALYSEEEEGVENPLIPGYPQLRSINSLSRPAPISPLQSVGDMKTVCVSNRLSFLDCSPSKYSTSNPISNYSVSKIDDKVLNHLMRSDISLSQYQRNNLSPNSVNSLRASSRRTGISIGNNNATNGEHLNALIKRLHSSDLSALAGVRQGSVISTTGALPNTRGGRADSSAYDNVVRLHDARTFDIAFELELLGRNPTLGFIPGQPSFFQMPGHGRLDSIPLVDNISTPNKKQSLILNHHGVDVNGSFDSNTDGSSNSPLVCRKIGSTGVLTSTSNCTCKDRLNFEPTNSLDASNNKYSATSTKSHVRSMAASRSVPSHITTMRHGDSSSMSASNAEEGICASCKRSLTGLEWTLLDIDERMAAHARELPHPLVDPSFHKRPTSLNGIIGLPETENLPHEAGALASMLYPYKQGAEAHRAGDEAVYEDLLIDMRTVHCSDVKVIKGKYALSDVSAPFRPLTSDEAKVVIAVLNASNANETADGKKPISIGGVTQSGTLNVNLTHPFKMAVDRRIDTKDNYERLKYEEASMKQSHYSNGKGKKRIRKARFHMDPETDKNDTLTDSFALFSGVDGDNKLSLSDSDDSDDSTSFDDEKVKSMLSDVMKPLSPARRTVLQKQLETKELKKASEALDPKLFGIVHSTIPSWTTKSRLAKTLSPASVDALRLHSPEESLKMLKSMHEEDIIEEQTSVMSPIFGITARSLMKNHSSHPTGDSPSLMILGEKSGTVSSSPNDLDSLFIESKPKNNQVSISSNNTLNINSPVNMNKKRDVKNPSINGPISILLNNSPVVNSSSVEKSINNLNNNSDFHGSLQLPVSSPLIHPFTGGSSPMGSSIHSLSKQIQMPTSEHIQAAADLFLSDLGANWVHSNIPPGLPDSGPKGANSLQKLEISRIMNVHQENERRKRLGLTQTNDALNSQTGPEDTGFNSLRRSYDVMHSDSGSNLTSNKKLDTQLKRFERWGIEESPVSSPPPPPVASKRLAPFSPSFNDSSSGGRMVEHSISKKTRQDPTMLDENSNDTNLNTTIDSELSSLLAKSLSPVKQLFKSPTSSLNSILSPGKTLQNIPLLNNNESGQIKLVAPSASNSSLRIFDINRLKTSSSVDNIRSSLNSRTGAKKTNVGSSHTSPGHFHHSSSKPPFIKNPSFSDIKQAHAKSLSMTNHHSNLTSLSKTQMSKNLLLEQNLDSNIQSQQEQEISELPITYCREAVGLIACDPSPLSRDEISSRVPPTETSKFIKVAGASPPLPPNFPFPYPSLFSKKNLLSNRPNIQVVEGRSHQRDVDLYSMELIEDEGARRLLQVKLEAERSGIQLKNENHFGGSKIKTRTQIKINDLLNGSERDEISQPSSETENSFDFLATPSTLLHSEKNLNGVMAPISKSEILKRESEQLTYESLTKNSSTGHFSMDCHTIGGPVRSKTSISRSPSVPLGYEPTFAGHVHIENVTSSPAISNAFRDASMILRPVEMPPAESPFFQSAGDADPLPPHMDPSVVADLAALSHLERNRFQKPNLSAPELANITRHRISSSRAPSEKDMLEGLREALSQSIIQLSECEELPHALLLIPLPRFKGGMNYINLSSTDQELISRIVSLGGGMISPADDLMLLEDEEVQLELQKQRNQNLETNKLSPNKKNKQAEIYRDASFGQSEVKVFMSSSVADTTTQGDYSLSNSADPILSSPLNSKHMKNPQVAGLDTRPITQGSTSSSLFHDGFNQSHKTGQSLSSMNGLPSLDDLPDPSDLREAADRELNPNGRLDDDSAMEQQNDLDNESVLASKNMLMKNNHFNESTNDIMSQTSNNDKYDDSKSETSIGVSENGANSSPMLPDLRKRTKPSVKKAPSCVFSFEPPSMRGVVIPCWDHHSVSPIDLLMKNTNQRKYHSLTANQSTQSFNSIHDNGSDIGNSRNNTQSDSRNNSKFLFGSHDELTLDEIFPFDALAAVFAEAAFSVSEESSSSPYSKDTSSTLDSRASPSASNSRRPTRATVFDPPGATKAALASEGKSTITSASKSSKKKGKILLGGKGEVSMSERLAGVSAAYLQYLKVLAASALKSEKNKFLNNKNVLSSASLHNPNVASADPDNLGDALFRQPVLECDVTSRVGALVDMKRNGTCQEGIGSVSGIEGRLLEKVALLETRAVILSSLLSNIKKEVFSWVGSETQRQIQLKMKEIGTNEIKSSDRWQIETDCLKIAALLTSAKDVEKAMGLHKLTVLGLQAHELQQPSLAKKN